MYLITGSNGVGKITLLGCIDRICNSTAFMDHFKAETYIRDYNKNHKAIITYSFNDEKVIVDKKIWKKKNYII